MSDRDLHTAGPGVNTDAKIEQIKAEYLTHIVERWDYVLGLTDSPVERLFLAALWTFGTFVDEWLEPGMTRSCEWATVAESCGMYCKRGAAWPRLIGKEYAGALFVQPSVHLFDRDIRMDFALLAMSVHGIVKVCVEIDGHDFHERTKEQARRDKSRDRQLQRLGWTVLRFTGSEVFQDACECASEAVGALHPLSDPIPGSATKHVDDSEVW